jgi:hypothetical protein
MPLKSLIAAFLGITLSSGPLWGASLLLQYGGPLAGGNQQWNVVLRPDSISAAAVEIGFQFTGGSILQLTPNVAVLDDLNPGQNPFTGSVTTGVSIHNFSAGTANAAFASLGGVVPTLSDTLVLTLVTSGPGTMSLGGQNHNGFFIGARAWQGAVPTNALTASLQVTGLEADFNADGRVNGADFLIWQRGLGRTTLALRSDGDANADGAVNATDLAFWRGQFGNAAIVPASAAVPEAGSLALAVIATAFLLRRRLVRTARTRSSA